METNLLPFGIYKTGDVAEPVKKIQEALCHFGYSIKIDGIYGNQTKYIIKSIQKKYPQDVTVRGIYNLQTRVILEKLIISGYQIVQTPETLLVLVNKLYSLTEDYIPRDLMIPNVKFSFDEILPKRLLRHEAAIALEKLFNQASQNNINLSAVSGYRPYDRQAEIFADNIMKSPNANLYSARPGESEHQTGLAMDVSCPSIDNELIETFAATVEGKWIIENAPTFGFIIRFPKGKESITGYQYEPWHLRYVGLDDAKSITNRGLTLEEYVVQKNL